MPIFRPTGTASPSLWDWDVMLDRNIRPNRLFDQHFGLALDDDQIFTPAASSYGIFPYSVSPNYRPRRLHSRQESGVSQVDCNKEVFEVKLDVQQFTPEEISVKTVNTTVVIEGRHDEKQDEHGYISRHFVRKYILPEDVKPETVVCNLSSDGVLSISAPRVVPEEEGKETVKVIPIVQTGRPAVVSAPTSGLRQPYSGLGTASGLGLSSGTGAGNTTVGNTTNIKIQREKE